MKLATERLYAMTASLRTQVPTQLQLDFNQPVQEGAGDFTIDCGPPRSSFSASVRSRHAWVGPAAATAGGATVTLFTPGLIAQGNCTVFVPAGAYLAAATGAPSVEKTWSFTVGKVKQRPPFLPRSLQRRMLSGFDSLRINETIAHLSLDYENRFFASASGEAAAAWLAAEYKRLASAAGRSDVRVEAFAHAWRMPSVIVTIPGRELASETVVLGAHLDTINRQNWTANLRTGRAPGANDDASGVAVQLEVFRLLLATNFRPMCTVELHTYSGEEEGLYGSADVAAAYARSGRLIAAMLQLDQCGYVSDPKNPRIAVYTDNTNRDLSLFITKLVGAYTSTPFVRSNEEKRADSDFHSWHGHGFPAAYAAEGTVDDIVYGNNKHTPHDEIGTVDLQHVLEFARLAMGFLVEVGTRERPVLFA